jgi:hypothetical protein
MERIANPMVSRWEAALQLLDLCDVQQNYKFSHYSTEFKLSHIAKTLLMH